MMKERGFSFSEVMIALLLITSISLALLKQQWQIHRLMAEMQCQEALGLSSSNDLERRLQSQRGVGLIEWMIGLALALSLLTLCLQQFAQIQQQSHAFIMQMDQAARIRVGLDLIRQRGHQAGWTPCLPLRQLQTRDHRTGQALQMLSVYDQATKITLRHMDEASINISVIQGQTSLHLPTPMTWDQQYPLMIADCQHAEVHTDYYVTSQRIIHLAHPLTFVYHPPIYVGRWLETSFWVKSHQLFYQQQHAEALLSGVVALHWQWQPPMLHLDMGVDDNRTLPLDIRVL